MKSMKSMKSKKKLLLALLLLALCALCAGCASLGYVYTDAGRYTSGGGSIDGRVKDLDINWTDGSVLVTRYQGSRIRLSETASGQLTDDTSLHWYLDGSTLRVQYAASGLRLLPRLHKQLVVELPASMALDEVEISVASAQVEADGLEAEELVIRSASGRVALRQQGLAEKVKVETASGGVAVAAEQVEELRISTASGMVVVDAMQVDEADVNTASGNCTLQFATTPDRLDVNAVSGTVTILLPQDAGFTADVDTLSGVVGGSLQPENLGKNTWVHGNGKSRIQVDTVSGDVYLNEHTRTGQQI